MSILGALGDLVLALSADTAKFQSDLGKAERMAKKFGQEVGREFGRLANQIAALAGAGGFGALIKSQIDAAEEAGKMSQKLGITTESFSGLRHAAHMADLSVEQFQMGMRKLVTGMADAQRGTGEAKDAFALLGISVTDAEGKLKKGDQALLELAEKFSQFKDGTAKADLATRIFGERIGLEMIPFLNMGREGIEKLKKEAEALGIVFDDKASKAANEFNDNLKTLQGLIKGLAVDIAGPFVEAINKAAKAMKDARAAGNSGFIAAFRELFVESDATLAAKEVEEATRIWLKAEDQLQQARHKYEGSFNEHGMLMIANAEDEARRAKSRLEQLIKRNRILLGEEQFTPPEAPASAAGKTDVPTFGHSFTPDEIKKREEAVLQARIRAFGILEQAGKEADEAELKRYAYLNEQREKGEQAGLENSIALMEEGNRRKEELGQAYLERRRLLKEFEVLTDEELENKRYEEQLAQFSVFTDKELELIGGRQTVIEQMEQEHQQRLLDIRSRSLRTMNAFTKAGWIQQAQTIFSELAGIFAGVALHDKKLFELNKVAGIANAIINTYQGISKTLATYPWPLAGVMAAAHAVAGFAQVRAIQSATFGAASFAPSLAGSTPAQPVTPVGETSAPTQTTIINLKGGDSILSTRQVRQLLKEIEEATRGGGRVVVA